MKVFSPKLKVVASLAATPVSNPRKFSLWKSDFRQIVKVFSLESCAVRVTIFSNFRLVSNFAELHALIVAARSRHSGTVSVDVLLTRILGFDGIWAKLQLWHFEGTLALFIRLDVNGSSHFWHCSHLVKGHKSYHMTTLCGYYSNNMVHTDVYTDDVIHVFNNSVHVYRRWCFYYSGSKRVTLQGLH